MGNLKFLLIATKTEYLVNLININKKFLLKFSKKVPVKIQ